MPAFAGIALGFYHNRCIASAKMESGMEKCGKCGRPGRSRLILNAPNVSNPSRVTGNTVNPRPAFMNHEIVPLRSLACKPGSEVALQSEDRQIISYIIEINDK